MNMTRSLGAVLLATICGLGVQAQESVEGYWEGALIRDGSVRLQRVEIFREGKELKALIASPDWMVERPPAVVTQDGKNVRIDFPDDPATLVYDAVVGEMVGFTVASSMPQVRVHLKRSLRPPSIPIATEDVRIPRGDVTIAGTIVTPPSKGPHPLIVWLHGRGKATRQGHRGIARRFAERGVASFIYDKRGAGESTGDYDKATKLDLANDALAAIEFLAKRPEIDRGQIGVRGNSAGGWVAPIVATRSRIPLAFIITTVGPAESVRDQQIHVAQYKMRRSDVDFTADEYAAAKAHMELVTRVAYTGEGWSELRASNARAKGSRWAKFVGLPEDDNDEDIKWVRHKQYDPGPDLSVIKTPFLALYGQEDYVVPPEVNVPKLRQYLTAAGNKDFTIMVIPEAGHALSYADGVRHRPDEESDYYWLWAKGAPLAIQTQIDWLLARVKLAK